MTDRTDKNRVIIFDTTMRDGEQSPGCSMSLDEKQRIAAVLEELGVDVIEAGFPIASNGDFEAVKTIAAQITECSVAGLARASRKDIDRAWEALQDAKSPRIHTFLSTSPLHMKFKLQMEPEAVHQAVIDSVTMARNLCETEPAKAFELDLNGTRSRWQGATRAAEPNSIFRRHAGLKNRDL